MFGLQIYGHVLVLKRGESEKMKKFDFFDLFDFRVKEAVRRLLAWLRRLEAVLTKHGVCGVRPLLRTLCPVNLLLFSLLVPTQACQHGNSQHLEHLLFYGADSASQNASGNTALHICALYNKVQQVSKTLLFSNVKTCKLSVQSECVFRCCF